MIWSVVAGLEPVHVDDPHHGDEDEDDGEGGDDETRDALLHSPDSAQLEDVSAVDCLPPGLALLHLDVGGDALVLAATHQEAGDVPHEDGGVAELTWPGSRRETQSVQHDSLQAEELEVQTGGWLTLITVFSLGYIAGVVTELNLDR